MTHSQYARSYLDSAGLRRTKSIICEYNSAESKTPLGLSDSYPSRLAMALILAQKSSADMMMYSSSDVLSLENGLFSVDDRQTHHHYAAYNVMRSFASVAKLSTVYDSGDDHRKELYSLATCNGKEGALMCAVGKYEGKLEIILADSPFEYCTVSKITSGGTRGKGNVYHSKELQVSGGRLLLSVKSGEVYTVSFFNK
jgi:hypothetical protein